jgi:hypothetical protein
MNNIIDQIILNQISSFNWNKAWDRLDYIYVVFEIVMYDVFKIFFYIFIFYLWYKYIKIIIKLKYY